MINILCKLKNIDVRIGWKLRRNGNTYKIMDIKNGSVFYRNSVSTNINNVTLIWAEKYFFNPEYYARVYG